MAEAGLIRFFAGEYPDRVDAWGYSRRAAVLAWRDAAGYPYTCEVGEVAGGGPPGVPATERHERVIVFAVYCPASVDGEEGAIAWVDTWAEYPVSTDELVADRPVSDPGLDAALGELFTSVKREARRGVAKRVGLPVAGLGLVGGGLLATMAKSPTARKVGIAAAVGGLLAGAVSLALVARTPIDEREAP
jgi:hypothetical protein